MFLSLIVDVNFMPLEMPSPISGDPQLPHKNSQTVGQPVTTQFSHSYGNDPAALPLSSSTTHDTAKPPSLQVLSMVPKSGCAPQE